MEEHVGLMHSSVIAIAPKQRLLRFDRFLQCHPELARLTLAELVEHQSHEDPPRTVCARLEEKIEQLSKAMPPLDPP